MIIITRQGSSFIEVIIALLLLAIVAAASGCAFAQYFKIQKKLEIQLVAISQ